MRKFKINLFFSWLSNFFFVNRENASKLASGRSVLHRADKENELAKKKPIKPQTKPQNIKKDEGNKSVILKKSESVNSLIGLKKVISLDLIFTLKFLTNFTNFCPSLK